MKITNITFIEQGDSEFKVSFLLNGHNLQTANLKRTSTREELRAEVKRVVDAWVESRAEDNFNALKTQFEGKEITL